MTVSEELPENVLMRVYYPGGILEYKQLTQYSETELWRQSGIYVRRPIEWKVREVQARERRFFKAFRDLVKLLGQSKS